MRFRLFALGASILVAATGCRTDPNTVLVERELRLQEDEIYRLHDCVQDYRLALESARRRVASLERQLEDGQPDDVRPPDTRGPDFLEPPESPREDAPRSPQPMPAVPIVPKVELGEPTEPEGAPAWPSTPGAAPPRTTDPDKMEEAPRWNPPGSQAPGPQKSSSPSQENSAGVSRAGDDSSRVARVLINRALTGGIDVDGRPGDEGLLVVVEPRDERDRYLAAPAEITVVVLDPARDSRIARWEYTIAETAELFHDSTFGRGIQLEMGWPKEGPKNRDLHVFVRYTTADGRKLDVDQAIRVEPRVDGESGWAARPARSRQDDAQDTAAASGQPTSSEPQAGSEADGRPSPRTAGRIDRPAWSPERLY